MIISAPPHFVGNQPPSYFLESDIFKEWESYTPPVTVRHVEDWTKFELIPSTSIPSLQQADPRETFHDPTFREKSVVWNPDSRYEEKFIYSVKFQQARVFVRVGDQADFQKVRCKGQDTREKAITVAARLYSRFGSFPMV